MQGRLSPLVNGKIQAFPWQHWREEFKSAQKIEQHLMEWTLDQEDLYKNPFMTEVGQQEIINLCRQYRLRIDSLTGDCFMQAPFFKSPEPLKSNLLKDLEAIVRSCGVLGVHYIVFPLVDNSSLKTEAEEICLREELVKRQALLKENKVEIVFESDFPPQKLKDFIANYPEEFFGINYDMGNSASLGFNPEEEFAAYGNRVTNVHVKDRVLGGTTVPLGTGNAQFDVIFSELKKINYKGNFILQTARSPSGEHEQFVVKFTNFVMEKLQTWN